MKPFYLLLPVIASLTLAGCNQQQAETDSVVSVQEEQNPQIILEGFTDTVELELVPVEEAPVVKQQPVVKKVAPRNNKPETIYVETDGAQGRVWGHVTMRGDRGSGTIHDWDENTLTVTVTRHGNELFAVDQNSRQYVFRLNK